MRQFKLAAALLATAFLASCGGGSTDEPSKPKFGAVISFGDSLSDAGTYAPATINPASGLATGGKFTTNPGPIWIEDIAAKLGLAITPNIVGFGPDKTKWVVCAKPSCTAYGQGGSRVTAPNGINNENGLQSGALTLSMKTQIDNHLSANGGAFKGDDLVFVYGGNNDVFFQAGYVNAVVTAAAAAPGATPATVAAAAQQARQTAGTAMATAATELAGYIKDNILAKGAKYVVVMNLPDSSATPYGASLSADGKALLVGLVNTFNTTFLQAINTQNLNVLVVDANAGNKDVLANPKQYAVSNTTQPACDAAKMPAAAAGSSLFCNPTSLYANVDPYFLFADAVHPTVFGHKLFADFVTVNLAKKGWL